jgi:glycosyltransferase involved in cell wall biosynthesis
MISIIIPTLNEEKYISDTLRSIKSQCFEDKCEIIVVDGMSKDNTVRIAKKYADKVIVIKKRGIAVGRNAGARIAKGDILLFCDADTIPIPNALTEITKEFKKKNVVAVTVPIIPLSHQLKDSMIFWMYNIFVKISINFGNAQIPGVFVAYRKETFDKVNGFNESIETWEDYDLSSRIDKHGKIVYSDKTLVLSSLRRIEKWGRTKSIVKYLGFQIKYLLTGKGPSVKYYEPIR